MSARRVRACSLRVTSGQMSSSEAGEVTPIVQSVVVAKQETPKSFVSGGREANHSEGELMEF